MLSSSSVPDWNVHAQNQKMLLEMFGVAWWLVGLCSSWLGFQTFPAPPKRGTKKIQTVRKNDLCNLCSAYSASFYIRTSPTRISFCSCISAVLKIFFPVAKENQSSPRDFGFRVQFHFLVLCNHLKRMFNNHTTSFQVLEFLSGHLVRPYDLAFSSVLYCPSWTVLIQIFRFTCHFNFISHDGISTPEAVRTVLALNKMW